MSRGLGDVYKRQELDSFIGHLQKYGKTETQIVFSTPVKPRGIDVYASGSPEEPESGDEA